MVMRLVISALCIALAACGAKQSKAPAAAPHAATVSGADAPSEISDGDPRSEIERLSAEVDQRRGELGLAEPQAASVLEPATPMSVIPLSTDATCKPAKTERCESSCKISDSICNNAARICELAQQLAGDTWAAGKCTSAKQTCDAANKSCCTCQ